MRGSIAIVVVAFLFAVGPMAAHAQENQRGPTVRCLLHAVSDKAEGHAQIKVPAPEMLYSHDTEDVFMYVFMAHRDARMGGNAEYGQKCWSPDNEEVVKFYFPKKARTLKAPVPASIGTARVRLCARSQKAVRCFNGEFEVYGGRSKGKPYKEPTQQPYTKGGGQKQGLAGSSSY